LTRCRIPEVLFGALLAVAIFGIGMVLESSRRPPANQKATSNAAKENHDHPPERSFWNWVTHDAAGFFTLWLVIVGGGQLGLFYWQLRLIRIAADDAKKAGIAAERAADATTASVDLARSTAEKQLRAYVLVTNMTMSGVEVDATPSVKITIRNSGQTPAHDIAVSVAIGLIDYPPVNSPPNDDADIAKSISILGPQSESLIPAKLEGVLHYSQAVAINTGAKAIHIFGDIKYVDAFGIHRRTDFSSFYGGEFGTNDVGAPTHAPTGNNAT
jgi:hypothetical protein